MSNRWIIGGLIVGAVALAVYIGVAEKRSKAPPETVQAEISAAPVPAPAPQVLPTVVDVLDIDPLLDPPAIPPAEAAPPGVVMISFDEEPVVQAAPGMPAPAMIPPAIE